MGRSKRYPSRGQNVGAVVDDVRLAGRLLEQLGAVTLVRDDVLDEWRIGAAGCQVVCGGMPCAFETVEKTIDEAKVRLIAIARAIPKGRGYILKADGGKRRLWNDMWVNVDRHKGD